MCFLDRCRERCVVELGQGSEWNHLVESNARRLLGVAGEVLGICHDAGRLDAVDIRHAEHRCQVGVLSERLEDPTTLGYTGEVEFGSLGDAETLRPSFGAQNLSGPRAIAGLKLAATPMAAGSWVTPDTR